VGRALYLLYIFRAGLIVSGGAVLGVGLDLLDAETVGSNSAKGMDVCPRLFIIVIQLLPYHDYVVYLLRKRLKISYRKYISRFVK
jgi:hypothetical protein